jgi:hypothetical protein
MNGKNDWRLADDKEITVNNSERKNAITKVHALTHVGFKPPRINKSK